MLPVAENLTFVMILTVSQLDAGNWQMFKEGWKIDCNFLVTMWWKPPSNNCTLFMYRGEHILIKRVLNNRFLHFLKATYTLAHKLSTSEMKYRFWIFMAGSVQTVVFSSSVQYCTWVPLWKNCCLQLHDWFEFKMAEANSSKMFVFTCKYDSEGEGSMLLQNTSIHLEK